MVLDTSAIIAAIANESDGSRYRAAMFGADSLLISAVTVLETKVVLFARFGSEAVDLFDELLEKAGIVVVSFDGEMAKSRFRRISAFRQGSGSSGSVEHCRLCCICAGEGARPAPSVQGRRLRPN